MSFFLVIPPPCPKLEGQNKVGHSEWQTVAMRCQHHCHPRFGGDSSSNPIIQPHHPMCVKRLLTQQSPAAPGPRMLPVSGTCREQSPSREGTCPAVPVAHHEQQLSPVYRSCVSDLWEGLRLSACRKSTLCFCFQLRILSTLCWLAGSR